MDSEWNHSLTRKDVPQQDSCASAAMAQLCDCEPQLRHVSNSPASMQGRHTHAAQHRGSTTQPTPATHQASRHLHKRAAGVGQLPLQVHSWRRNHAQTVTSCSGRHIVTAEVSSVNSPQQCTPPA
jgi:hypothetical protein